MRHVRHFLLPLLVVASLLLSPPAGAATTPVVADVQATDADVGLDFRGGLQAAPAFFDANGNGAMDLDAPDEPIYLDLDASHSVTFGDVRLTAFFHYPAGSVVDVTNRDVGRALATFLGWFGRDGPTWYLDGDGNGQVNVGDLRFDAMGGHKVRDGEATGQALSRLGAERRLSWTDADGNGKREALDPLYIDGDPYAAGSGKTSAGDMRLAPQGLGLDDEATTADVERAVAAIPPPQAPPTTGVVAAEAPDEPPRDWRTLDWILVVLGVTNLAGLVVVGRLAAARLPRNPFK